MSTREKVVKQILDEMYYKGDISDTEYQNLYNQYTSNSGLSLTYTEQSDKTDSDIMNDIIFNGVLDISTVFDLLNTADDTITRHQKLNEAILNSIKLESNKLNDKITEYEKRINNANRFVRYEAFRDISGIEQDDTLYTEEPIFFDKYIEGIKLHYNSSTNMLLSNTGARLGTIEVTRQHGAAMASIKNSETAITNAIDSDMSSYWSECIKVDSPIEVEYEDIKRGAICELLITFNLVSEINEITITPFGEFPIEVNKISISDTDDGEFTPIVFKGNTNVFQQNKMSKATMSYQFADTKIKRMKLLLNQPHYVRNNFIGNTQNIKANGIFITEDKESLAKEVLGPVEKAIASGVFAIPTEKESLSTDKLQYEYGLYNILVCKNEFAKSSELLTTQSFVNKTAIIVLDTNEEHFIDDSSVATSIEYSLIGDGVPGETYPILPEGSTEVKWELLHPEHDMINNKMKAHIRFPAEMSSMKIYCDDVLMTNDYVINNEKEIEFVEFNPHANYCASYTLLDSTAATRCRIEKDCAIRLRAIFRQNSRKHTGVTAILYDYTLTASNLILKPGEENTISWIGIVPSETYIDLSHAISLETSDEPILVSITPNTNSISITTASSIDIDDLIG